MANHDKKNGADGKNNNVWINDVSEKLIRDRKGTKPDKNGNLRDFKSVSFPMMTGDFTNDKGEKKPIMGSILVSPGQVKDGTRWGKNKPQPNPGFKNVMLGGPEQVHHVSLNYPKNADGSYPKQDMTSTQIEELWKKSRQDYKDQKKQAQAAAAAAEAPAPEITAEAEAEIPEA